MPGESAQRAAFLQHPVKVLAVNDSFRRNDVGAAADLWKLDDVRREIGGLQKDQWPFSTSTRVCLPNTRPAKILSQDSYKEKISGVANHILLAMREKGHSLVTAGGAASAPFYEGQGKPSDIDFFVVGAGPQQDQEKGSLDQIIVDFGEVAAEFMDGDYPLKSCDILPGLVRFCGVVDFERLELQLILRAYPSISALLHGFDLGASAVAYDGETTWLTSLGAFAQVFSTNLVSPRYRSTTYEKRLVKYLARGYALGLVHLDSGKRAETTLDLAHLTLHGTWIPARGMYTLDRGRYADGDGITKSLLKEPPGESPDSDYAPEAPLIKSKFRQKVMARLGGHVAEKKCDGSVETLDKIGLRTVMEYSDYTSYRTFSRLVWATLHRKEITPVVNFSSERSGEEWGKVIKQALARPFNATTHLEEMEYIMRVHTFRSVPLKWRWNSLEKIQVYLTLHNGLTAEEKAPYGEMLSRVLLIPDRTTRDCKLKKLAIDFIIPAFLKRLDENYRRASAAPPCDLWIRQDPMRQYTSAINPIIENGADWYGEAYYKADPDSETSPLKPRRKVPTNGECPFCLEKISPGEPNTVCFPCGHACHYVHDPENGDCPGLQGLADASKTFTEVICPLCRAIVPLPSPILTEALVKMVFAAVNRRIDSSP